MADNEFSNWGRWGTDDEIGALNLVTPETTAAAIGSVKQGKVYSLASAIRESNVPRLEFRAANQHFVRVFGGPTRDVASVADDVIVVGCHGATTHVDALCHYWTGDKLYNGFPEDTVQGRGALRLGIENVKSMVTRGVMLDVAAAKGVDYLDGGYIITRADLDECCQKQGVELRAGDVALFRTGWPRTYYESAEKYNRSQPGLTWDSGMWFCERDVCAVGSDNSAIGVRTEAPYEGANVHALFLHQAGVYLIEMMELDELSRDKVYEFLFVMAPLLVLGATGSSVNPLAIV
ncbi:MAG: cyclase family protein [Chloroflexi bacterium]|nr:cyclase family protein [Chloroflexota bacterium]